MKISQHALFLPSLLTDVVSGRMMPAAMQRPYQWEKADVEALCDSIISGFPIGGMLLWMPGDKADLSKVAKGRLGPICDFGETAAWARMYLLLDGQHRLATLAWLMLQGQAPEADYSPSERAMFLGDERLVLDLESKSMKFVSGEVAESTLTLPAWVVMSSASEEISKQAAKVLRGLGDKFDDDSVDEMCELYDKARQAFSNARVTATTIQDATPEQAKHAFLRICRTGVPMSEADFERAMAWDAAA